MTSVCELPKKLYLCKKYYTSILYSGDIAINMQMKCKMSTATQLYHKT